MKTKSLFLLRALIAGLGLILAGRTTAQTFTTLHSFNLNDGANPQAGPILSGNTLYGTTANPATVFKLNSNGSGFTTLHEFSYNEGDLLYAGLILSGNTLYGTAEYGGSSANGTVFAVNTNGTGFTTLHNFSGGSSDGAQPKAGLILSGNTLYGTTFYGGTSGKGTVFKVDKNGTGYTNLHSFTALSGPNFTNSDGANPEEGLILSGNTLFGTASVGGDSGFGTVFKLNPDGSGFTNLCQRAVKTSQ